MQQFIETTPDLQQAFIERLCEGIDLVGYVPTGMAWFDLYPVESLLSPKSLAVVIYPNESLLGMHALRLEQQGLIPYQQFAVLNRETPPHAIRDIWFNVDQCRLPLLLLTADQLQSLNTLTQLIRHPNLGPLILEQGHLAIANAWGPQAHPYEHLSRLFQNQWRGRPSLYVFSHLLSPPSQKALTEALSLRITSPFMVPHGLDQLAVTVKRCVTQFQKFHQLLQCVDKQQQQEVSSQTIIVCHRQSDVVDLEKRLTKKSYRPMCWPGRANRVEKEMMLQALPHEEKGILLVESSFLSELPFYQALQANIQLVFWQLPWSCELLLQQTLLCVSSPQTSVSALLLYSKEDYASQRRRLMKAFAKAPSVQETAVEQLGRMRSLAKTSRVCRRLQLHHWLYGWEPSQEPCYSCDNCHKEYPSSLWSKVAHWMLY